VRIDLFFHFGAKHLARLEASIATLTDQGTKIMADLTVLQAAVSNDVAVGLTAIQLLNDLSAKIAAMTPDQPAIDALAKQVQDASAALAAAVAANTPAPAAPAP
jgi:hypothetical protein